MAKVIQLRGQVPGGWSRERWAWLKAVSADARLSAIARLVGNILAVGYANHETATCNPGRQALMEAVGASRATVTRALAELREAGWIEPLGGEGPGKVASYRFRPAERGSDVSLERGSDMRPESTERGSAVSLERGSVMNATGLIPEIPPIPPYKDEPNMNHNARVKSQRLTPRQLLRGKARPTTLSVLVPEGSSGALAWDTWLMAQGFQPLARIGRRAGGGGLYGFDLPYSTAPRPDDSEVHIRVALRFAEWLQDRA